MRIAVDSMYLEELWKLYHKALLKSCCAILIAVGCTPVWVSFLVTLPYSYSNEQLSESTSVTVPFSSSND